MPIVLPASVAPNELVQSSWGNAVVTALDYLDDNKLDNFTNDTMVGTLTVAPTATNLALVLKGGSEQPRLQLQSIAGSVLFDILATASSVTIDTLSSNRILVNAGIDIDVPSGSNALNLRATTETPVLTFESEAGTDFATITATTTLTTVASVSDLALKANATEQARLISGNVLVGKTASALGTVGVEILTATSTGSIRSTISAASIQNVYCRHEGSADANGEDFVQFLRGATLIGSIDQNGTTGVNFNVTSDERLKTDVGLDATDGLTTVKRLTVHRFGHGGVDQVGMFAQEMVDVIPSAVKVGGDDPHKNPWQIAYSASEVVAHTLLAVQQLAARVADLEAAV